MDKLIYVLMIFMFSYLFSNPVGLYFQFFCLMFLVWGTLIVENSYTDFVLSMEKLNIELEMGGQNNNDYF